MRLVESRSEAGVGDLGGWFSRAKYAVRKRDDPFQKMNDGGFTCVYESVKI